MWRQRSRLATISRQIFQAGCRFSKPSFVVLIERDLRLAIAACDPFNQPRGETIVRFLCIYKSSKPEGTPPTQQEIAAMNKLIDDMTKSGVLLSTEGCLPSALGARVRLSNGKITVTDGPFTEAKEVIGGFALIEVPSKQEAVEQTKNFLKIAGDGESEIRQVYQEPGK
jgi:hypothetical protein